MKDNQVPILPRKVLMGNPDKANVRLSPDGKYISYLAPHDGVLNIHVAPLDDFGSARPVTFESGQGVRIYYWSYSPGILIYRMDNDGDENFHIYSVDIESGTITDLSPFGSINGQIVHMSHRVPDRILLGINSRNPKWHDVHSVSLSGGETELLVENEGFMSFQFDLDMDLVSGLRPLEDGGMECLLMKQDGWERLFRVGHEDASNTDVVGVDGDGRLWLQWPVGRNTSALVSCDPGSGEWKTHAENEKADLYPWTVNHPVTNVPQAAVFDYVRREYSILDDDIADDIRYLGDLHPGDLRIAGRDLEDCIWLVEYNQDAGSQKYFLYDRAGKKVKELCSMRPELDGLPLSRLHPVVVVASDGMELVCYYTLPSWLDNPEGDEPEQPLPAVLLVHGGPWSRDRWRYNPTHQMLANRGYFVLSVNFRSSTGFGKEFINAGNGQWSRLMHQDLLDGLQWAIARGFADPDRIAIFGGSYGGYAALVGMTFTPDVFACGVDLFGPSNLVTLLEALPPYWEDIRSRFRKQIGALPESDEDREFLMERSPISRVNDIRRPLLIGQGANDPRVTREESDQIVKAMRAKGLPVTYILYPDEGHGFKRPENRLSFYAVAEKFLSEHIGGRFQPFEDAMEGSSMEVIEAGGLEDLQG
jgi:dipeptidyl aminopeptidase/acylaminoacyl peptidase